MNQEFNGKTICDDFWWKIKESQKKDIQDKLLPIVLANRRRPIIENIEPPAITPLVNLEIMDHHYWNDCHYLWDSNTNNGLTAGDYVIAKLYSAHL